MAVSIRTLAAIVAITFEVGFIAGAVTGPTRLWSHGRKKGGER